nr:MAG TPA: hypothetical protein [Caudoviricetes sp.]
MCPIRARKIFFINFFWLENYVIKRKGVLKSIEISRLSW